MAKTFNKQKLAEEALIKNEENIMKVVEERTAELLESKDRYRSLINNIPDVIWRTDSKGNSLFISSNVESVYGYTPDEIYQAGSSLWLGRIHPDDVEDVRKSFHQLYEKGIKLNIEYRIKRKDGQWIWLEDRSIGTYEKDGITYADGICSDITKRKQAENSLMRANKLESVGRLAFGIAHEISNPLTNISLGIQILKKIANDKEILHELKLIETNIEKASFISKELLRFSRNDKIKLINVNINHIIKNTLALIEHKLQSVKIHQELQDVPYVLGDPIKLEQVFINVLNNSIDAMPNGGKISISSSHKYGLVRIEMSDDGVGIADEHIQKVLDPFFTTKEVGKGTGLGLSICYEIIKQHSGNIEISDTGSGTKVIVQLPASNE